MTRTERRRLFKAIERRVLTGEPKAAVFADLTASGVAPARVAAALARVPTPQRRARWRWTNRLLAVMVAVAGVTFAASPLTNPGSDGPWFAVTIAAAVVMFGVPFVVLLRWHNAGYQWTQVSGLFGFWWTARPILGHLSRLGLTGALSLLLYAAVVVVAVVLWRRLFSEMGWWSADALRDAGGEYRFAD